MVKRKNVSFGANQVKEIPRKEDQPAADPCQPQQNAKVFRKNNRVIENNDFNFGTSDQRSENQTFVNEKVSIFELALITEKTRHRVSKLV